MINPELQDEVFGGKQVPPDAQCRSCKFTAHWNDGERWPESSSCEKYPPKQGGKPEPIRFEGMPCGHYEKDDV